MRGLYDAEVRHTDHWIGVLLDELESRGLTDDTLVVVTSDHGEEFLEHGGTLHNGKLYEELVRIPLLMRVPGQGPSRFSASVRNIDVMPTILDFCRAELPLALDAVSLRPLIEGVPASRAPDAIASFPVLPGLEAARMLRTERYKLVHRPDAPERGELYDLLEDPAERRNLHAQRTDLADSLRTRLEAAFAKPARESQQSGFDVSTLQAGAEDQHDEQIVEALERMSPEERDKLIEAAQQRRKAALHDGIDSESAAQLRAIGYLDD
jgi:arylsulfatase A-like enzyme